MIEYTVTLESPLHHGAGTAGNTSILRTQDIVMPDGKLASVPFLSANSVRHQIRDVLAWHTIHTLGVPEGSLSKAVVDLLFSGGGISATGAAVDLESQRRVEALYPVLGLLGYAAQSDIITSTLRVSHLHLLCRENAWRAPGLADREQAGMGAARFRGEDFGTRHDTQGGPVDRYLETVELITGTNQMIYDLQVIKPGAVLYGDLSLVPAASQQHHRVLNAALTMLAPEGRVRLGAKTSVGYGAARVDGWPSTPDDVTWWTEHLTGHREEILTLLRDLV